MYPVDSTDVRRALREWLNLSGDEFKKNIVENRLLISKILESTKGLVEYKPKNKNETGGSNKSIEFKRMGIANQGNTCYLNATLQVLRNSLCFNVTPDGIFASLLLDFYVGGSRPNSIIEYLEEKLKVNLREQSDAATYLDIICKILEDEEEQQILDNIKITKTTVVFQCSKCDYTSERVTSNTSYSIKISASNSLQQSINEVFKYTRDKECQGCKSHEIHKATKTFVSKHLVLVPQNPKEKSLKLSECESISIHTTKRNEYTLIGTVLHKGFSSQTASTFATKSKKYQQNVKESVPQYVLGGHYIAIVKDGPNWIVCDDSHTQHLSNIQGQYHKWTPTILVYKPN